jgi:hypothetical protein
MIDSQLFQLAIKVVGKSQSWAIYFMFHMWQCITLNNPNTTTLSKIRQAASSHGQKAGDNQWIQAMHQAGGLFYT